MLQPDERVVMISGASRGIGLAMASRLHNEGYRLSLGGRNIDALTSVVDGWQGPTISCHYFDASDANSQRVWVEECVETHGQLDGLINNAGAIRPFSLTDFDEAGLDEMWEINVKAPARLTSLVYPHLKAAPTGRVINIASLSGKRVRGGFEPGYAMTKHAVIALTHATRQQWWDDGIRATAICPTWVATDMIAGKDFGAEPIIEPDDLAEVIALVLSLPNNMTVAEMALNCRLEDLY